MRSLNSIEYWNELKKKSHEIPQIIFKHSNACSISLGAFESLKEAEETSDFEQDIHLVVVQVSRDISDLIEEDTGVKHESPQLLIIKDGEAVFHASHYEITGQVLIEELEKINQ